MYPQFLKARNMSSWQNDSMIQAAILWIGTLTECSTKNGKAKGSSICSICNIRSIHHDFCHGSPPVPVLCFLHFSSFHVELSIKNCCRLVIQAIGRRSVCLVVGKTLSKHTNAPPWGSSLGEKAIMDSKGMHANKSFFLEGKRSVCPRCRGAVQAIIPVRRLA